MRATFRVRAAGAGGLFLLLALITACKGEPETVCRIDVGDYIGPTTGYWYSTKEYCVTSQSQCEATCAALAGRPDIGRCEWVDSRYCWDGDLPPSLAESEVCAVDFTISCGGSPDTSVICGSCSTLSVGTSDYDPSTDCLSQYGSVLGRGVSCEAATADLHGGASCPYTNDGECDEPEGTNLCPEGTDAADCP